MSKTIASGVGMTNEWLRQQGLVSRKSLWAELAPPGRNLLRFAEPPDADPHVRWCGEGGPQGSPLPDFGHLRLHSDVLKVW